MVISPVYTTKPTEERIPLEKEVYNVLEKLGISYERVDNEEVFSMEECREITDVLGTEIRKNIFLCNQKKTSFFLYVLPAYKSFDTKKFCSKLGCSSLSFAPPEYMEKHLGTKPGSATVMGLLQDSEDYIQLIINKEIIEEEWFGCNVGTSTSHIKIKTKDLLHTFLPYTRHRAKIIEL